MSPDSGGLAHRPHVVPALVRKADVGGERLSVLAFAPGDLLGALREGFRQAPPREFKLHATRERRAGVERAFEERRLPVIRGGEYPYGMRRDGFERDE